MEFMELLLLVMLLILTFIGLVISLIKNKITFVGICSFILGTLCMIVSMTYSHRSEIKPIDVYNGNTTLEITYKDGIAIDSVVVWKNK